MGRRLRIAQVSPLIESVPPRQYGGTERVVAFLTDELVRAGHDLTLGLLSFHAGPGGYLAFLGRISPEKGVDRAIEIAKRTGLPLKIAAKVDKVDVEYFEARIKPLLDHPLVEFVGEIGEAEKD